MVSREVRYDASEPILIPILTDLTREKGNQVKIPEPLQGVLR